MLQLAADEVLERSISYHSIEVLDYRPSPKVRNPISPPGSVTVVVAKAESPLLKRLRDAAAGSNQVEEDVAKELNEQFGGRQPVSRYEAWRLLQGQPVFADVRYGGQTLATNLFPPPGLEAVVLHNPYNGGRLKPDELTLVEHHREGDETHLAALALRHEPPLTPAEKAAVEAVPENQLEMNMRASGGCCDSLTDFAQVVIAVTFAVLCGAAIDRLGEVEHLTEREIKRLGPAASARRIVQLRMEALGHTHA